MVAEHLAGASDLLGPAINAWGELDGAYMEWWAQYLRGLCDELQMVHQGPQRKRATSRGIAGLAEAGRGGQIGRQTSWAVGFRSRWWAGSSTSSTSRKPSTTTSYPWQLFKVGKMVEHEAATQWDGAPTTCSRRRTFYRSPTGLAESSDGKEAVELDRDRHFGSRKRSFYVAYEVTYGVWEEVGWDGWGRGEWWRRKLILRDGGRLLQRWVERL